MNKFCFISPQRLIYFKSQFLYFHYINTAQRKLYLSKQMDPDLSTPMFMEFHFTLAEIYSGQILSMMILISATGVGMVRGGVRR